MLEGEYSYKSFMATSEGKLDLGDYLPAVANLYSSLHVVPQDSCPIEELEFSLGIQNPSVVIALNTSSEVVGYGILRIITPKIADLSSAFVKESDRRRGIYKELVKRRIDIAKQKGSQRIQIYPAHSDSIQIPYFLKEGFQQRDEWYIKDL